MSGIYIRGMDMPPVNIMLLLTPEGEVYEMGDLLGDDKLLEGVEAVSADDSSWEQKWSRWAEKEAKA